MYMKCVHQSVWFPTNCYESVLHLHTYIYMCILVYVQDILRVLFNKDVKEVDIDMVVKKRNELMADRGKKVLCTHTHVMCRLGSRHTCIHPGSTLYYMYTLS